MSESKRTWVFWAGLTVVAFSSTVVFFALWSPTVIYPLLTDPRFLRDIALNTGMQPRSILDRHDLDFFQAFSWLSHDGSSYSQFDLYWKLLIPPIMGASIFILAGLYMMKSGIKKREEGMSHE